MAETDVHFRELVNAKLTLVDYFAGQPDVYIAANLLVYFGEGDPSASVAPDVFLVHGVPRGERRTYKVWEEGRPPEVVIEFSSRSTRFEDRVTKATTYLEIGTREYFLFDPLEEYLKPPFQGFRRVGEAFLPIHPTDDGSLWSEVLKLALRREGSHLRFIDPRSGQQLLTPGERAEAAENRADAAENRASELEAELSRLKALLKQSP